MNYLSEPHVLESTSRSETLSFLGEWIIVTCHVTFDAYIGRNAVCDIYVSKTMALDIILLTVHIGYNCWMSNEF